MILEGYSNYENTNLNTTNEVIEFGDSYKVPKDDVATGSACKGTAKKKGRTVAVTTEDMQKRRNDVKARTTLLLALLDEHQLRFSKYKTAQEFHLEFIEIEIEQDDLNQKFLTSLALEWLMHTIMWRNRSDLDTMSLDDLYNHLKVYEPEVQKKSKSNSQNMAFISLAKNSSGNREVNTASISTTNTQVSHAGPNVATMDIKWNMAFLSMRADRYWKKTWKKISIQGTDVAGFDKSKVECFNCYKMGHITRECRAPRSQERGRRENYRQGSKEEEEAPKALMAIDGVGWDWKFMANEEEDHALVADEEAPTEFALMAKSSYVNEVFDNSLCSKACKKNTDGLNTKIIELSDKHSNTKNTLYHYKLGLSQAEARLVEFKNQEIKFCEKIRGLELKVEFKTNRIESLTNELEIIKKEKEGLDCKLTGFQSASKDLDNLLENDTITDYSRLSPAIESNFDDFQNRKPFVVETGESSSTILSKPVIKFVKSADRPIETKTDKVETAKKPAVKYAELYRKTSKSNKGKAIKASACWIWKPRQNSTNKGLNSNCISVMFKKYTYIDTQGRLKTHRQHNMYSIDLNNVVPHKDLTCLVAKASANECMLWHRRLGHLNIKIMNRLVRNNLVRGLPSKCFDNDHTCVACLKGKQHKASCKTKLVNSVTKPLHTLHMDLFGPTSVSSLNHKWYCLVVTDDFSRFTGTFFLKTKDETSGILRNFITEIENLKDLKVKIIRCDNGGEFRNKEMNDLCSRKRIKREFSNARTPQQNGVTKRRNRTLIEAAKTMLVDAKLHVTFWAEAVNTACYVQNRVLVNKSQNKTPYELFNGRTPAIGFLKPFGCHVMILNTLDHLGKFDAKWDEGYFIGYSMSSKAFRVFNKRTKRVEENLHVDFLENKAIKKGAGPKWLFDIASLTNSMNYVPVVVAGTNSTNFSCTKESAGQDVKKDVSSLRYIALPNWFHEAHLDSSTSNAQDACNVDAPESSGNSNPTTTPTNPPSNQMETLTVETPVPTNVWSLVDCPKGVRPIRTKWVFKNKKDERGMVIRNKARLVTQRHTQEERIDYDEMDVKSAFLYGTIDEEVYVIQPLGFQNLEFPARVYKVEKAMYGLHQAPRAWYGTLSKYLLTDGFQKGTIDQTLFIKRQRGDFILVQVYVDDIIFGSSNPHLCREFKALMHEKFQMSAMGELNFFLGLQVLQKKNGIFLSQDKYIGDILKKFGYSDVRSANTPMDKENRWGKDGTRKDVDLHLYRSMIGSLMYLSASRPDIMFAVCACDRYQVTPKECHMHAVKRIFRYLKFHPKLGLWYPKESPSDLVAYSDSDYGGATQDRKSTTRGCQFLGRRLISWQCKKQTIVATSITKAKYAAAASGCG
uniref:Retrovirus-related Pol polyprotein from transposon TNT 1-94 n=1 Tax=Tanacetum cinerariifolium TaxID=118510 RepID=A0A6L2JAA5_TANCI|nr:retrovirus-related Pol polyprotein from transposon TNT 1-94 [Tanacetum cinerariifolium]